jgi:DHA1 family bicyclomycin/chloramphenicol resistance-like MFS transporter
MPASSSSQSPSPARLAPEVALLLLAMLLSLQPISTDLYLPALPTLTAALGSTIAGAQLTLGVLSLAFGVAQMLCGPLADRYGRRPVLVGGLWLYVGASLASALAPNITWLVVARGVQGAAMAAGVVGARAMLRDLYEPEPGARVLARALTGLGLCAVLSPIVGGAAVAAAGWRATMLVIAAFAAVTLWLVATRYRETTPQRNPDATRLRPMLSTWLAILRNRTFARFAALSAATYAGVYAYLSGATFVLVGQWGVSRPLLGLMMGVVAAAYISGTVTCRRLVPRLGVPRTIGVGLWFSLAGGASMLALSLAGVRDPWAIILPQCLYLFAHGLHQPCALTGAVGPFPRNAGAAAALTGFVMILVAFPIGLLVGFALVDASWPLPLTVFLCSLAVALSGWTIARRRDGGRSRSKA